MRIISDSNLAYNCRNAGLLGHAIECMPVKAWGDAIGIDESDINSVDIMEFRAGGVDILGVCIDYETYGSDIDVERATARIKLLIVCYISAVTMLGGYADERALLSQESTSIEYVIDPNDMLTREFKRKYDADAFINQWLRPVVYG